MRRKTVVLFSGGPDSAVALYQAYREGDELLALTLANDHRGSNAVEVACARALAKQVGAAHTVVDFGFTEAILRDVPSTRFAVGGQMGGCVPTSTHSAAMGVELMHVAALFHAANHGASRVLWSVHADDLAGATAADVLQYLALVNGIVELRTSFACRLETPFLSLPKSEVIALGSKLNVRFQDTFSCVENNIRVHCGECEQCLRRISAFSTAGVSDPARFEGDAAPLEEPFSLETRFGLQRF